MGFKLYKEVKQSDGTIIGLTRKGYEQYQRTGTYSEAEFIGYKKINGIENLKYKK